LSDFRSLNESALDRLDSDALIAHIREASDLGHVEHARRALGVLVFRHYDNVRRRVAIRIPPADVEDVAMNAVTSAIKSAFDGTAVGQFVRWLNRIVDRRIADYHRKPRVEGEPLPEEHSEAEDVWGTAGATEPETGGIEIQQLIEQAMPENQVHCEVIHRYVFEDLTAHDTADVINDTFGDELERSMTAENVHKIASRFRETLRQLLDERDT
jgi:DNA-directed RNA polymerase specialized sigma24 family protein